MSLGETLKDVVPTLARALGGPFAGLAIDAIGKALKIDGPTREKIEEALRGPLTGDQIVTLRQAQNALLLRMRELDIQTDQLEVQDRMNAREREVKAGGR